MAEQVVADKLKLSDAPKKLKSKMWQYFGFRDGSPTDKAKSKLCFTDVAYAKSSSTTNLMQYVKRKHNVDLARLRGRISATTEVSSQKSSSISVGILLSLIRECDLSYRKQVMMSCHNGRHAYCGFR
ncbi:hypothetical protein DPMN_127639 [Dreissena polymorpha]|uniref:Uncharacterized protein n=1 Tax=Dreissena polymorpha TaxID=45954 RepID=A0A9D4GZB7_DREPO|nr:hypothetical protein DPMN_127639 [Dreissena polymorpha]